MHLHDLNRGQRLALTIFLAAAILLPLIILTPRYISWQVDEKQQEFNRNLSDSNTVIPAGI